MFRQPSVADSFTRSVLKSHHVVSKLPCLVNIIPGCYGWERMASSTFDAGGCWRPSRSFQSIPIAKRFDHLALQGKDVLPDHKPYPIMTQNSKLVTPAVVFNILNAEQSSLATSFALSLNAGSALVENPSNLFVESFNTAPVLHVQDCPSPNAILMVYEACMRAQRPERMPNPPVEPEIPTPPVERPGDCSNQRDLLNLKPIPPAEPCSKT
ncbi:uncharacterized protein TNCV_4980651 [Trichonephila clavipes]|nr:uncharacterized protein TNCV_4980651 [Trichonephila clavipes]